MKTFLTNITLALRSYGSNKWRSLIVSGATLLAVHTVVADAGQWTLTGNLNVGRFDHAATLLPSGKVLVTGGTTTSNTVLASAELYDPVAGTWATTGSLNLARLSHTSTLLANSKVLVAGGNDYITG